MIKTIWNTQFYDPNPPPPKKKKNRHPDPVERIEIDPQHHLIYAAMLDGCCVRRHLATRLGLSKDDVRNAQRLLERKGYIVMGRCNHHKAYVPCEVNA